MKPKFKLLKYNKVGSASSILLHAHELAGHFDIEELKPELDKYSIHTEYCARKRYFSSKYVKKYKEILAAHYPATSEDKLAKLWVNENWAKQFAGFVIDLAESAGSPPTYIEIHPPFKEYTSIDTFLLHYKLFSNAMHSKYPQVQILIENRSGSLSSKKFLISTCEDLKILSEKIDKQSSDLKIALDIPQIQTAYKLQNREIEKVLDMCKGFIHNVMSVHLWGRQNNKAHIGNLDSYFASHGEKQKFLNKFGELFSDNITRLMVIEVNSSEHTKDIIDDLKTVVEFVK